MKNNIHNQKSNNIGLEQFCAMKKKPSANTNHTQNMKPSIISMQQRKNQSLKSKIPVAEQKNRSKQKNNGSIQKQTKIQHFFKPKTAAQQTPITISNQKIEKQTKIQNYFKATIPKQTKIEWFDQKHGKQQKSQQNMKIVNKFNNKIANNNQIETKKKKVNNSAKSDFKEIKDKIKFKIEKTTLENKQQIPIHQNQSQMLIDKSESEIQQREQTQSNHKNFQNCQLIQLDWKEIDTGIIQQGRPFKIQNKRTSRSANKPSAQFIFKKSETLPARTNSTKKKLDTPLVWINLPNRNVNLEIEYDKMSKYLPRTLKNVFESYI